MSQKKAVCPRCERAYLKKAMKQHRRACKRVPTPEELCQMLDERPELSVTGLRIQYGTSHDFIYHRLEGTRWPRARLLNRSRRCQSLRQVKRVRPTVAEPRCVRCEMLLAASDLGWAKTQLGDLCGHCLYELARIAQRLIRPRRRYRINRLDRELLRRWIPQQMELL